MPHEIDYAQIDDGNIEFLFYADGTVKYRTSMAQDRYILVEGYLSEKFYNLPLYLANMGISHHKDARGNVTICYKNSNVLMKSDNGKKVLKIIQKKLEKSVNYFYTTITLRKYFEQKSKEL